MSAAARRESMRFRGRHRIFKPRRPVFAGHPADGKMQIAVYQMQPGQSGTVIKILGGPLLTNRLHSLGIRPGRRITKVSGMFMWGPVTLQVGRAQVAIGYGMAGKIIVEVEGEKL